MSVPLCRVIRFCPVRTVLEYGPEVHECGSIGKVGIAASLSVTLGFENSRSGE